MAAKRKKKEVPVELEDQILISLKERYFKLIKKEKIGKTKDITKQLDDLEFHIRNRQEELKNT